MAVVDVDVVGSMSKISQQRHRMVRLAQSPGGNDTTKIDHHKREIGDSRTKWLPSRSLSVLSREFIIGCVLDFQW